MSDDEADPELVALLRQHLGLGPRSSTAPPETKVLDHARFIYDNSVDVALDMRSTKTAADLIWNQMQQKKYSTATWSEYELHPKAKDESTVDFIFTMDLLNFSFWSENEPGFEVEWQGKKWTGYWSMVAALQRALHEGIPITDPSFWIPKPEVEEKSVPEDSVVPDQPVVELAMAEADVEISKEAPSQENEAALDGEGSAESAIQVEPPTAIDMPIDEPKDIHMSTAEEAESSTTAIEPGISSTSPEPAPTPSLDLATMRHIFRSSTATEMPMLDERLQVLQSAGAVLAADFNLSIPSLIKAANHSAARLVNLLAEHFACFKDEARFERKTVRLLKRAQIFVADLWAAFDGQGYGAFDDIDCITMFADYRIPQALQRLGCIWYSPPLESQIKNLRLIEPGHSWELQIRGCSIWSIELIRREILAKHPGAKVNAILLDFFLYDTIKELEAAGDEMLPHHRTRSIWY